MNETPLSVLRADIEGRHTMDTRSARNLTDLELREYQKLMKRVNAADPYVKRA